MALPKIGHAAMGEDGTRYNDPGDQTKKEVTTRTYYYPTKEWAWIFRPVNKTDAEKIAKCMEDACGNDMIGYDQADRLTLYNAVKDNKFKCDKNSLKKKVECDCSALVRVCLAYAGIHVEDFRTRQQVKVLSKNKKLKKIKFKGPEYLERGDILLTKIVPGHTVIVLTNGEKAGFINEKFIGKETSYATSLKKMNVRCGTSTKYKSYGTIEPDTKVQILNKTKNGWLKIVYPYCSKGYAYVSNVGKKYFI